MSTFLTDLALVVVAAAVSGLATGAFAQPFRGITPPETCSCGAPRTAGHQCGGTR